MAEDAAGAAVQVLIRNLLSLLSREFKLVRGFEDNLAKLQSSLSTTQMFLSDAEEKEINERAAKEWLKQLENVAFEADATLDEINYQLLQKKLKKETHEVLCSFSSGSTSLFFHRKMAHKIDDLNKKFQAVNRDAVSKGLEMAIVNAHAASTVGLVETDSFSVESNVIERENDVAKIVEMLVNAPVDEKISVIPIFGMGGLGKTTLAQQVFQTDKIKTHFEEKIWVCVSFNFDELTLFQTILKTLTGEDTQGIVAKEIVLQKIHKVLASKRYLLILDDLWNEDLKKWEDFLKSLLGISNVTQNVIIVTTRQENVTSIVKTLPPYRLMSLSEDGCWSIIKSKALLSIYDSLEFEELGKCIARRCGGLPLAANVIGGMLRGQPKDEWSSILKNPLLNHGQDENPIMRILKLSYNRLPSSSLKRCFAYCSVFPQDFAIEKQTLIELWLAEGFLQTNQENENLETIGNRFFNHLLQASLLQVQRRNLLGFSISCIMHDLVHDLACSISGYRSAYVKDKGKDMTNVRYLYLDSGEPYHISNQQAKYLRTLIFSGKVDTKFFSCFSCLHSLTLTNRDIEELPIVIGEKIHLRFLDISSTRIKYLPDSVSNLFNLQTLVVQNLKKLPNTITDLLNLRNIHISSIELPPFIGKLTSLRTLSCYKVGDDKGCKIGELENMNDLGGKLQIQNLERVTDRGEAGHANLFGKENIFELCLEWSDSGGDETNHENVLEGLQPHPNLKSFEINGYKSKDFPLWTMKMRVYNATEGRWIGLTNLIDIRLYSCNGCEEMPNLGHLPCLKYLLIYRFSNIRSIGPSFYGLGDCSSTSSNGLIDFQNTVRTVFPALRLLYLLEMPNLIKWVDTDGAAVAFPCLYDLQIRSCPNLKSVPSRFPFLGRLWTDKIDSDIILTNICANTRSLHMLEMASCFGMTCVPSVLFVNNQGLTYLEIHNCANLKMIGSGSASYGTGSTEHSLELGGDLITLQSLKHLDVWNCPELITISNLQFMALEVLCVSNCPRLVNLPKESCCLRSLRKLELGGFSKTLDVVHFNDYLKCILHENNSLQELCIRGNEDWDSLPDHIKHLNAVKTLSLYDLGIELLPEWIENFTSLRTLFITNCKMLRCMPSKETMHRLINFSELWISGCSFLTKRCRAQQDCTPSDAAAADDSDWPKIFHIKSVYINNLKQPTRNSPVQSPAHSPVQDEKKFAGCFRIPRNWRHSDSDTDSNES